MQLENRVALVTGGGRGIGQGIALALAEAGADVAVADVDATIARETADKVEQAGCRSTASLSTCETPRRWRPWWPRRRRRLAISISR